MIISDTEIAAMRRCASHDKPYRADVEISVRRLFENTGVEIEQLISETATGSLLGKLVSEPVVVDYKPTAVIFSVTLDVKEVIKELNASQLVY